MNELCVICGSGETFVKKLDEPRGWHCIKCAANAGNPTAIELLDHQRVTNVVEELFFPQPLCTETIQ